MPKDQQVRGGGEAGTARGRTTDEHQFIADRTVSISRDPPLAEEEGLGEQC
jgi:hypothetical protein